MSTGFVSPSDPALGRREVPTFEPGGRADGGVLIFILLQQPATRYTQQQSVELHQSEPAACATAGRSVFIPSSARLILVGNTFSSSHEIMNKVPGIPDPTPRKIMAEEGIKELKSEANSLFRGGDYLGAATTFERALDTIDQVKSIT